MKYYEVKFTIDAPAPLLQDVRDVVSALAGEAGFETFEDTPEGLTGYVQRDVFSRDALAACLEALPFEGVGVAFDVGEAEDRDWNEAWEQEGFDPIVVGSRCVVHDGRHLGGLSMASYPLSIEIDVCQAFGTGTHETTRMMVDELLATPLQGCRVLDCGCGTGILGICALKGGAAACLAYDIDEWSVDNTRHNAVINGVDDRLTVLHGDASVLDGQRKHTFGVVMANINRNILLADMARFCDMLAPEGVLLLSGFYEADIPQLWSRAGALGLHLVHGRKDGQWACLRFTDRIAPKQELVVDD